MNKNIIFSIMWEDKECNLPQRQSLDLWKFTNNIWLECIFLKLEYFYTVFSWSKDDSTIPKSWLNKFKNSKIIFSYRTYKYYYDSETISSKYVYYRPCTLPPVRTIFDTKIRFGRLRFHSTFLCWLGGIFLAEILINGFSYYFWTPLVFCFIYIFVILHEYGHLLIGSHLGYKTNRILMTPIGGLAEIESFKSKKDTIFICAAGPLVNFYLLLIFSSLYILISSDGIYTLMKMNLIMGLFNLIPIYPLDGGHIFDAIFGVKRSKQLSFILSIPMIIYFVYNFIFTGVIIVILCWIINKKR